MLMRVENTKPKSIKQRNRKAELCHARAGQAKSDGLTTESAGEHGNSPDPQDGP